jgi:glutamate--cysteine ligase
MARATDSKYERRLSSLVNAREPGVLQNGLKGVERESLRVLPDGSIAHTPHPAALGAALTSEHITTDFSESLIELVTPPFSRSWELLQYLTDLHQFVYRHLGDELLWATSMPCRLSGDADVPTAFYGPSNVGRMKSIYREGLRNRYGALMQAISGVHFNYSFPAQFWDVYATVRELRGDRPQFQSASYFDLLRNYRRHGWIVLYLFGVSPAVGSSFLEGDTRGLVPLDAETLHGPYATSLRMSDVGYRNRNQADISVSVNSLTDYLRDLRHAIQTPHPPYQQMEAQHPNRWLQLNTNVLQIENEYYSYIRPKRVAKSGESPSAALRRGGVEYVEMRALDCSAFDPVGVNQIKLRFLEAFAAFCLLRDSPSIDATEQDALDDNHLQAARRGREPGLMLHRAGKPTPLPEWATEILDGMEGICELLDHGDAARPYAAALRAQREKVSDVERTPSARMLRELRSTGESFYELALRVSRLHKEYFLELHAPNDGRLAEFSEEARESLRKQAAIEAAQTGEPIESYLKRFFATASG